MNSLFLQRIAWYHAGRTGLGLGLLLILWSVPATALVPEPYALYYGQAKNLAGEVLTRESAADVIVMIDGRENARYRIGDVLADNVNYVVRVKVDDGTSYLYDPAAAREGDVPEIVIRTAEAEYDVEEEIPPISGRGAVNNVDIEAVPEPCAAFGAWLGAVLLARRFRQNRV